MCITSNVQSLFSGKSNSHMYDLIETFDIWNEKDRWMSVFDWNRLKKDIPLLKWSENYIKGEG